MQNRKSSNTKEAFNEGFNLLGMAGFIGLSLATLNPLPFLVGVVAQVAYLMFVPDSKWYNERLEARYDKEVAERRSELKEKIFPVLTRQEQIRFINLERMRDAILPPGAERKTYQTLLRRLDYLLEKFLMFASKRCEFQEYLVAMLAESRPAKKESGPVFEVDSSSKKRKRVDAGDDESFVRFDEAWAKNAVAQIQESYQSDIEAMMERMANEENLHNKALFDKRIEILNRRSQYSQSIGDTLSNLTHQLQLMEDTFGLIADEIRARSPEQILADVEDVVNRSDRLAATLSEVSPFDEATIPDGAEKLYN